MADNTKLDALMDEAKRTGFYVGPDGVWKNGRKLTDEEAREYADWLGEHAPREGGEPDAPP